MEVRDDLPVRGSEQTDLSNCAKALRLEGMEGCQRKSTAESRVAHSSSEWLSPDGSSPMSAGSPLLTGPHTVQTGGSWALTGGAICPHRMQPGILRPTEGQGTWRLAPSSGRTPIALGHSCLSGERQTRSREHTCGCGLSFPLCEMGTVAKGSSRKAQPGLWWLGGQEPSQVPKCGPASLREGPGLGLWGR